MTQSGILVTFILLTYVLSQTARHRVWERPPVERIPIRDECNVVLAFVGGPTQIVPGSPHQRRRNRFQPRDQWDFTCLGDFFHTKGGIALYRLIATDEALARTIRAELALRGVDQQNLPSEIPLIARLKPISAALVGTARHYLGLPADEGKHHIALISAMDTLS